MWPAFSRMRPSLRRRFPVRSPHKHPDRKDKSKVAYDAGLTVLSLMPCRLGISAKLAPCARCAHAGHAARPEKDERTRRRPLSRPKPVRARLDRLKGSPRRFSASAGRRPGTGTDYPRQAAPHSRGISRFATMRPRPRAAKTEAQQSRPIAQIWLGFPPASVTRHAMVKWNTCSIVTFSLRIHFISLLLIFGFATKVVQASIEEDRFCRAWQNALAF